MQLLVLEIRHSTSIGKPGKDKMVVSGLYLLTELHSLNIVLRNCAGTGGTHHDEYQNHPSR